MFSGVSTLLFGVLLVASVNAQTTTSAPAVRSLRLQDDDGNVTLYIDPTSMGSYSLGTTGFSAEAALKASAMYYGTYAPLATYRTAGGGNALKLGTAFNTAASSFGLTVSTFSSSSADQTGDFVTWATAAIDANQPIAVGLYNLLPSALALSDYDHVGLLVGYITLVNDTAFRYLDLETNAIRVLPASGFATRTAWTTASSPTTAPYNYRIASPTIFAVAITGAQNIGAGSAVDGRAMIHAPQFTEPSSSTAVFSTLYVSIVSLTFTNFYGVLTFNSTAALPAANITFATPTAISNVTLSPAITQTLFTLNNVVSSAITLLRVVKTNAPPATTPPLYTVLANGTCTNVDVGVYSLDASSVSCSDLGRCRLNLCTCLGVGDSDRCWMRSFLSCTDYVACFAVASHCIETAARFSTTSNCQGLRDGYASVAPSDVTRPMSSVVWDYEFSTLSQQCSAFICNAAQLYYYNTGCTVDESLVCDPPNYIHLLLTFSGGTVKLDASYQANTDLAVAVASDVTTIAASTFRSTAAATVLQITTDGTLLTYNLRLENTNMLTDNRTKFINQVTSRPIPFSQTLAVLAAMKPAFGGKLAVQSLSFLDGSDINGLFDPLKNCDNSCLLAIVIVGLILMLIVFAVIGVCYVNFCRDQAAEEEETLATTVRRVKELRRRKAALDNEDDVALDGNTGENVPFGSDGEHAIQRPPTEL